MIFLLYVEMTSSGYTHCNMWNVLIHKKVNVDDVCTLDILKDCVIPYVIHRWKDVGIRLGVPLHCLEWIDRWYGETSSKAMRMFKEWLNHENDPHKLTYVYLVNQMHENYP